MPRVAMFLHGGIGDPAGQNYMPSLVDLVSFLSERADITVFTGSRPGSDRSSFRCGRAFVQPVAAAYNAGFPSLFLSFLRGFNEHRRRKPFDLVHGIWGYPGGATAVAIASLHHLPSVVSIRGGEAAAIPSLSYGHMVKPLLRWITLQTCHRSSRLVMSTNFQAECMRRFGLRRADIRIIPSGVHPDWLHPPVRREIRSHVRFLHVANLTAVKDQRTLLDTFRILSGKIDSRLRIIGPDYLQGELQRYADEIGVRQQVEFLGYVHRSSLAEHFDWASIMLHTSLYEGQGMVLAEAAGRGVVVCGTAVGLIHDLQNRAMIGVEPGNSRGLAEAVLALLENPQEFAKLQDMAFNWAREHTIAWTANQIAGLYEEAIWKHGKTTQVMRNEADDE